jgi:hypothetical protein
MVVAVVLLTELSEAQPVPLLVTTAQGEEGAEVEAPVRRDHHHPPVLDAGGKLQEAEGLGRQAVVKAGVGAHLHLQAHHRQLF